MGRKPADSFANTDSSLEIFTASRWKYTPSRTARRLYERLGFRVAGRLRGANLLNNRRYDEIFRDLLGSEFELKHVARIQGLEGAG
jgi:hypothetical protein